MADGQVSVGGALSFAWSLLSQHWRTIWAALALNALSWTVIVAGLLAGNWDLLFAGSLGTLLTKYPVYGAVVRAAAPVNGKAAAPVEHLGLHWGRPELRMIGADMLVTLFIWAMAMLVAIALFAPVAGVLMNSGVDVSKITTREQLAAALGPHGSQIVVALTLACYVILGALLLRLSLALVASAESGRVVVLTTWRLTRGHFWQIAASSFIVSLPLILALTVTGAVAPAGGPSVGVTPAEIFTYALLTGVLAGAATTPLMAGVQLYFYRRLGPVPPREDGKAKA